MKTFAEQTIENVTKQILEPLPDQEGKFHDLLIQIINPTELNLSTPEGRGKAFVAKVDANPELGTQEGKRIRAYVRGEMEEHTNVSNQTKKGNRQSKAIIFNIFDSGTTSGEFINILGEIEEGNYNKLGGALYELTGLGTFGRVCNPSWPEFYITTNNSEGKRIRVKGKRKNPDGSLTEQAVERRASSRPMFLLEPELKGIESRVAREFNNFDFVSTTVTADVDTTESDEAGTEQLKTSKTVELGADGKPLAQTG